MSLAPPKSHNLDELLKEFDKRAAARFKEHRRFIYETRQSLSLVKKELAAGDPETTQSIKDLQDGLDQEKANLKKDLKVITINAVDQWSPRVAPDDLFAEV